eukprot:2630002-Amphidinium_carterae.1
MQFQLDFEVSSKVHLPRNYNHSRYHTGIVRDECLVKELKDLEGLVVGGVVRSQESNPLFDLTSACFNFGVAMSQSSFTAPPLQLSALHGEAAGQSHR